MILVFFVCIIMVDEKTLKTSIGKLFWRRRNRNVIKLLKRYAAWKGSKAAENYPEWMHVSFKWNGLNDIGTIVLDRFSRVLGKRKFEGHDYVRASHQGERTDEISVLGAIMEDNEVSSPEEFDLWLSQRGF